MTSLLTGSSGIHLHDIFPSLQTMTLTGVECINLDNLRDLRHLRLQDLCLKHSLDNRTQRYYEQNSTVVPVCGDPSSFGHSLNEYFPELTTLTIADHLLGNERAKSIVASHRNFTHLKSIRLVSIYVLCNFFL